MSLEAAVVDAVLSPEEQDRAAGFHFATDRRHFERRRCWLRLLLGAYLDVEPARVRLDAGRYGKPSVRDQPWLRFSVSHSSGHVLYAFAHGRAVGVDLERLRPDIDGDAIADSFFAERERRELASLPEGRRVEAFYRGWTRKEAYVKARGEGLSLPFDRFEVSLGADTRTPLLASSLDPAETDRWTFVLLSPFAGYVGSLAVEGPFRPPRLRMIPARWPPRPVG
jgi:4'-phosphopantetheinyl transferase